MVQLKWIAVQGWSKLTKASGNKNQGPRHPQKQDLQGARKHNVCPSTPYSESLPIEVYSQKCTLEKKIVGKPA